MSADNMERFRSVFGAVLGVPTDRITDAVTAEATDTWDSLNHINLISALEQEFRVQLPAERLADAQSVADLKNLLGEHGVEFA